MLSMSTMRHLPHWCVEGNEVFEYYKKVLKNFHSVTRGMMISSTGEILWEEDEEHYKERLLALGASVKPSGRLSGTPLTLPPIVQ